jgi:hypothetical protein
MNKREYYSRLIKKADGPREITFNIKLTDLGLIKSVFFDSIPADIDKKTIRVLPDASGMTMEDYDYYLLTTSGQRILAAPPTKRQIVNVIIDAPVAVGSKGKVGEESESVPVNLTCGLMKSGEEWGVVVMTPRYTSRRGSRSQEAIPRFVDKKNGKEATNPAADNMINPEYQYRIDLPRFIGKILFNKVCFNYTKKIVQVPLVGPDKHFDLIESQTGSIDDMGPRNPERYMEDIYNQGISLAGPDPMLTPPPEGPALEPVPTPLQALLVQKRMGDRTQKIEEMYRSLYLYSGGMEIYTIQKDLGTNIGGPETQETSKSQAERDQAAARQQRAPGVSFIFTYPGIVPVEPTAQGGLALRPDAIEDKPIHAKVTVRFDNPNAWSDSEKSPSNNIPKQIFETISHSLRRDLGYPPITAKSRSVEDTTFDDVGMPSQQVLRRKVKEIEQQISLLSASLESRGISFDKMERPLEVDYYETINVNGEERRILRLGIFLEKQKEYLKYLNSFRTNFHIAEETLRTQPSAFSIKDINFLELIGR